LATELAVAVGAAGQQQVVAVLMTLSELLMKR
jgi:hypothetical protein